MGGFSLRKKTEEDKKLKVETYQSKHLAQIMDSFEQMNKLIESQEAELSRFLSGSH